MVITRNRTATTKTARNMKRNLIFGGFASICFITLRYLVPMNNYVANKGILEKEDLQENIANKGSLEKEDLQENIYKKDLEKYNRNTFHTITSSSPETTVTTTVAASDESKQKKKAE